MENSNFDDVSEIIGQSLYENASSEDPESDESIRLINKFLNLAEDSYVLIQWPESQEYMEEEWFDEEAILDVEGKFGSSAYFIPLKRLL